MTDLKTLVAERLSESVPIVRNRVLDLLVDEEVSRRVSATVQVVRLLDKAKREGHKFKPDDVLLDREGKVISEGYKRETVDAIKKNADTVSKLTEALDEALDEVAPKFDKVLKLGAEGKEAS